MNIYTQYYYSTMHSVTSGPFLIKHTDNRDKDLFVTVSEENEVQLTSRMKEALPFYIRRVSKYSNYFEIIKKDEKDKKDLRFTATVNWRGHAIHPPMLRRTDTNGTGRSFMAIYDKESRPKDMKLKDPSECGKKESDTFFISCYTKAASSKDTSYLIVNRKVKWPWSSEPDTDLDPADRYWIGCAPSIKRNGRKQEPMLFKLQSVPQSPEEEHAATSPPPRQDDADDPIEETDVGPFQTEVIAEVHSQATTSQINQ